MKSYTNQYTQKVYEIISPLLGEMMAQGTIKSRTAVIGVNEETLKKTDLPLLAEEIRKGLVVFLGGEVASVVSSKIAQL